MVSKKTSTATFTVPGLSLKSGHQVAATLQGRLYALNDLQLTLKHAHWNVVGRDFIGVHEMLDPQIELVRAMIDETAERIATLGLSPNGLPGALVRERDWDDYAIGRASTTEHLAALDLVYDGVVSSHRDAIAATGDLDPITEDMLIGQTAQLELFQWFMRAHLESSAGKLSHGNAPTEKAAAAKTKK
ncbi:Dps family protein [Arthrobacter glacialis]|uniref:DNA starvation/stationary phase protection protein n=1 Tax=Arthrobacter glacialis TaxID=1664 RepID=A0A2S3ZT96_ARTGL|nr:DNA starvation/stationary phase protection protein [Arthrobacter glacialis]POH57287.1 DNA starvation/stationary phase protection protein [Arthrobacter glacialis]POH72430.1 DNA starvation/stationary phase protection protein [Arthrobacter glacialis]